MSVHRTPHHYAAQAQGCYPAMIFRSCNRDLNFNTVRLKYFSDLTTWVVHVYLHLAKSLAQQHGPIVWKSAPAINSAHTLNRRPSWPRYKCPTTSNPMPLALPGVLPTFSSSPPLTRTCRVTQPPRRHPTVVMAPAVPPPHTQAMEQALLVDLLEVQECKESVDGWANPAA